MLTFHLRNGAKKDFTLGLFVLDRSKDLVDHSLGEFSLLALLQLLFVADPAVQYGFDLGRDGNLLLLNKGFCFEFCGFLDVLR